MFKINFCIDYNSDIDKYTGPFITVISDKSSDKPIVLYIIQKYIIKEMGSTTNFIDLFRKVKEINKQYTGKIKWINLPNLIIKNKLNGEKHGRYSHFYDNKLICCHKNLNNVVDGKMYLYLNHSKDIFSDIYTGADTYDHRIIYDKDDKPIHEKYIWDNSEVTNIIKVLYDKNFKVEGFENKIKKIKFNENNIAEYWSNEKVKLELKFYKIKVLI
jgi:hypothetical protein